MPLGTFAELHECAGRLPTLRTVAVAGGADPTVLEAMRFACDHGWVKPIVIGRKTSIRAVAMQTGLPLDGFEIVDAEFPAPAAVGLVRDGSAQILMKGQIGTPALMAPVLHPETGLRTVDTICQVVLLELRTGRRFLLADTGICIQPTLEQKAGILKCTVAVARSLGCDRPRVAVMAPTEAVNQAMPETLDAAELAKRADAGEFGACDVRGPLSFDLAFAADPARKKGIAGAVTGAADVMLFPNLLSANLVVKAIMYTADCQFGGVLCGASCPVVFMSRADSTATRLNSLALALKLASH